MFKKIGTIAIVTALLIPLASPITSHAAENTANSIQQTNQQLQSVDGLGNQYSEEQTLAIMDAISTVDKYISVQEGKLVIDPNFKNEVEPFVYDHYIKGFNNINQAISSGTIKINENTHQLENSQSPTKVINNLETKQKQIQYGWNENHWWGIEFYLNKNESQKLQNKFADSATYWSYISAIAALCGGVAGMGVAIGGIISAMGNYYLYAELRDNTSSRGSILTFKWTPPSAYAVER
ncbi:hypothetical protein V7166_16655 [Bacillus thuringiensis]